MSPFHSLALRLLQPPRPHDHSSATQLSRPSPLSTTHRSARLDRLRLAQLLARPRCASASPARHRNDVATARRHCRRPPRATCLPITPPHTRPAHATAQPPSSSFLLLDQAPLSPPRRLALVPHVDRPSPSCRPSATSTALPARAALLPRRAALAAPRPPSRSPTRSRPPPFSRRRRRRRLAHAPRLCPTVVARTPVAATVAQPACDTITSSHLPSATPTTTHTPKRQAGVVLLQRPVPPTDRLCRASNSLQPDGTTTPLCANRRHGPACAPSPPHTPPRLDGDAARRHARARSLAAPRRCRSRHRQSRTSSTSTHTQHVRDEPSADHAAPATSIRVCDHEPPSSRPSRPSTSMPPAPTPHTPLSTTAPVLAQRRQVKEFSRVCLPPSAQSRERPTETGRPACRLLTSTHPHTDPAASVDLRWRIFSKFLDSQESSYNWIKYRED